MRRGREGYILTLTLGVLLALALLFMALLELPGSVRRRAVRVAREVQEVYDAESCLLLHLEGFPHGQAIRALWGRSDTFRCHGRSLYKRNSEDRDSRTPP